VAAPITRRIGSILDTLWYAGSARATLMVVLALLALTMGVAALFPQQPPGLEGAAAERWLASTAGDYPAFGRFLSQVGVFAIYESPWLSMIGAILTFNLALRLAIEAAALAQSLRSRKAPTAVQSAIPNPQSAISTTAGSLLAYAGALILLAGLFLNGVAGWRATEIALAPGSRTAVGRTDAPWLSLEELTGSEADPVARIALADKEDEDPTDAAWVAGGRPMRKANLWIALRSAGPALLATARDSRGRPLLLQSLQPGSAGGLSQGEVSEEVHLLFPQTQAEQEFALPSANLSFRAVSYPSLPEQGINVPVFLVEVYEENEPAPTLSDFVADHAILVLGGSTLELQRDRYAIVDAAYLPGLIPLLLGGLVLLSGVILALWSTPRMKDEAAGRSPGTEPDREPAHAA
jgi:hypothetical protein